MNNNIEQLVFVYICFSNAESRKVVTITDDKLY